MQRRHDGLFLILFVFYDFDSLLFTGTPGMIAGMLLSLTSAPAMARRTLRFSVLWISALEDFAFGFVWFRSATWGSVLPYI